MNTRFTIFFKKKNVILYDYLGTITETVMLLFTLSTLEVELVMVWYRLIYGTFGLLDIMDLNGVLNFLGFLALLGFLEFYLYYLCSSYADSSYWHDIAIISYVCKADPYFWCSLRRTLLYLIFLWQIPAQPLSRMIYLMLLYEVPQSVHVSVFLKCCPLKHAFLDLFLWWPNIFLSLLCTMKSLKVPRYGKPIS